MNRNLNGGTEQHNQKKRILSFSHCYVQKKNTKMHGKHHVWQNDTTLKKKMYFECL